VIRGGESSASLLAKSYPLQLPGHGQHEQQEELHFQEEEQHQTLVKLAINNIFFTFHLGEPSTSGICSLIVFGSVELGVLLNQLGVAKLQLSGIRNEGSKSCAVDLKVHLLRHLHAFPPCNFRS